MSIISDFFKKIFGKKQKMLDVADQSLWTISIPNDYETLNQYIEDGYIDVNELTEKEFQYVCDIMNRELEKQNRFNENLKNQKLGA